MPLCYVFDSSLTCLGRKQKKNKSPSLKFRLPSFTTTGLQLTMNRVIQSDKRPKGKHTHTDKLPPTQLLHHGSIVKQTARS